MIILACATMGELCRLLPGLRTEEEPLTVAGHSWLPCVVGVGPVAAALRMGMLLERHPAVSGIVHAGICGSYNLQSLPLGAPCVATTEIWPEYGVHPDTGEPFSFPMLPGLDLDPPGRIPLDPEGAATAMGLRLPADWQRGPSVTVAGVSATPERAQHLARRYAAVTENMEGFAVALAARIRNLPVLEVRTVSNLAGERNKAAWNFKLALNALTTLLPELTQLS